MTVSQSQMNLGEILPTLKGNTTLVVDGHPTHRWRFIQSGGAVETDGTGFLSISGEVLVDEALGAIPNTLPERIEVVVTRRDDGTYTLSYHHHPFWTRGLVGGVAMGAITIFMFFKFVL